MFRINGIVYEKAKNYDFLCNYLAIFSLCVGFIKRIKGFRRIHSFFMTISMAMQFTAVTLYWSYKKVYFKYFSGIKTGNKNLDMFVEYTQHLLLFLACLLDPFILNGCRKFTRLSLFMAGFGYVAFLCNNYVTSNTWPILFLSKMDEISKCLYFGFIIFLPQIFYSFLMFFMK